MKQKTIILLGLLIIITSCSTIVESKTEILNFDIEISEFDSTETLLCKLTGNTADSALWIKSYNIEYKKNAIFIIIEKSLRPTGISNPYFIQFLIPEKIESIYLGQGEIIWQRSN